MTPYEAAELIGCSTQNVRHLIRTGKLPARPVRIGRISTYEIAREDAIRIRDNPPRRGRPRGSVKKPRKAG